MNWIPLTESEQLQEIKSSPNKSIIFKHSTRCSISMMAKKRLEMEAVLIPQEVPVYYLDLLNHREISNTIAEIFQVVHQSPQLLVIKNGDCVFEASHGEISGAEAAVQLA